MKKPFNHISVDLETLGTTANSAIISIGACAFNDEEISPMQFYLPVDLQSCIDAGFALNADTIKWWMSQSKEAQAVFKDKNAVDIETALKAYKNWIYKVTENKPRQSNVWSLGASFDIPMISYGFDKFKIPDPIPFWNHRCLRTLQALYPKVKLEREGEHHNAKDDAIHQAKTIIEINKQAGGIIL